MDLPPLDTVATDLQSLLLGQEPWIRLSCFLGVLGAVALAEALRPRRPLGRSRLRRWPANLLLVGLDTLLLRLVLPAVPVAFALQVQDLGWGLFHQVVLPAPLALIATVLLLDLAIYGQHVIFHKVPVLWRLHRMHHADLDIDVTTALRFHPLEILLSTLIKLALVALLGAPAAGVLLFEVLLNASAMFNHGNMALPAGTDRLLRRVLVTPDMHRVHHSTIRQETDSNYGFALPWWDRLFGTYRAQPAEGHTAMRIGLETFRDERELGLIRLLTQPFRRASDDPGAASP